MQIDLQHWLPKLQNEGFVVRESRIANEVCYLVFPAHAGVEWNSENLIFRSSVWDSNGKLISAGFKKFSNWFEQPDLNPIPRALNSECQVVEKIDGSSLIVGKFKGELIVRTRGTFDVSALGNGSEIELLKQKYPRVFDFGDVETYEGSYLYEWVTPNNRIVLPYPEPDLYLIGHINHYDYSMTDQTSLNQMAIYLGNVKRPKRYHFDSIDDMLAQVELFEDKEGVCCYYNRGQNIRKIKAADYLLRHRLKDHLRTTEHVLDFYLSHGCPDFKTTYDAIVNEVDFETAEECKQDIQKIISAKRELDVLIQGIKDYLANRAHLSRKELAFDIVKTWDKKHQGLVLTALDNKILKEKAIKQLLLNIINA